CLLLSVCPLMDVPQEIDIFGDNNLQRFCRLPNRPSRVRIETGPKALRTGKVAEPIGIAGRLGKARPVEWQPILEFRPEVLTKKVKSRETQKKLGGEGILLGKRPCLCRGRYIEPRSKEGR